MRLSTALTGSVVLGLAQAISPPDGSIIRDDGCVDDALHECFTQSLVKASSYCTASVVTATNTITEVATVTPTVTITAQTTETATERVTRNAKFIARRKRATCGKLPLDCLRNLGTFQPAQLSSACSCIGVTAATSTELATVTATEAATETSTEVITVTMTQNVLPSAEAEPQPEESSTEVPSTTSDEPASTSSANPPPPPPVLTNADFEAGTTEGWSVISSTGPGFTTNVIPSGANDLNNVLELATSYFTANAATSVAFGQRMACEAGKQYRLVVQYSVASNYSNGSPWSVTVGGTMVVSGTGASVAWSLGSAVVTCAASSADNLVKFNLSSNSGRAARLLVDFVTVTPV